MARTPRRKTTPPAAAVPLAAEPVVAPVIAPAPASKLALVLTLLGREGGATLVELSAATGWLPHTVRAALSGLRKKGHAIAKAAAGGAYRVGQA